MRINCSIFLACLASTINFTYGAPTLAQEAEAIDSIKTLIRGDRNFIPKAVRLVFHDCFGSNCDGCIDGSNKNNKGLEGVIDQLASAFQPSFGMSRADFWALAGVVSLREAASFQSNLQPPAQQRPPSSKRPGRGLSPEEDEVSHRSLKTQRKPKGNHGHDQNQPSPPTPGNEQSPPRPPPQESIDENLVPSLVLKYGRVDCVDPTSLIDFRNFPDGHQNLSETLAQFRAIGLTDAQTVALVGGGHSLGGANLENSGFKGVWTPGNKFRFDNQYFQVLRSQNWSQKRIGGNFQFKTRTGSGKESFMLNADIALQYDVDFLATGRDVSGCSRGTSNPNCGEAQTAGLISHFADDGAAFLSEFETAFQLLMELGSDNLEAAQ